MGEKTKEPQYQGMIDRANDQGLETLGLMTSYAWNDDPKRLTFTLSRYKFVAKMFAGRERVLEIGCADAFGTRIVRQEVQWVTAVDFDPLFIADVKKRMSRQWPFEAFTHDILTGPVPGQYDGIFALDVIEHIKPEQEQVFMTNMLASLAEHGAVIIGTPSLESQRYASENSKGGHINCKTMPALKALMQTYFNNVFMFSMNDEVVHTGHHQMAHYLFAIACGRKLDGSLGQIATSSAGRRAAASVSFIVPALNESAVIESVVREIHKTSSPLLRDCEIILVDDGSTDGTGEIMDRLANELPNVSVLHNKRNMGVGAAYRRGLSKAKHDYVMMVCGDGGFPASSLPEVIDKIGVADIVIPYMRNLKDIKTPFRYFVSRSYTRLINAISGHRLHYYNGLPLHRKILLDQIRLTSNGFGIHSESIVKLLKSGYSFVEVGVLGAEVTKRSSALRLKNVMSVMVTIAALLPKLMFFKGAGNPQ
jgi:2-polyprenyl-3-methyl-5-hydroxy-6-metoxy-1,4-benzoquinol methylase